MRRCFGARSLGAAAPPGPYPNREVRGAEALDLLKAWGTAIPAGSARCTPAPRSVRCSNEWRYYRLAVWPDLFGRALLSRQWGRIGTEGRRRLDPHPDPGAAINALAQIVRAKRRHGYQDRAA